MDKISRRDIIKLGMVSGVALAGLELQIQKASALEGEVLISGGKDYSPDTLKERKAIPTACWQCVVRDAMIGYVEDGRLVKLEGHPGLPRTNGKLCAKGQGGIGQVYHPDRLLYPMKRVGKRGEGKWKRITWDEALDALTAKLKELHDKGTPEKFMFQYGRMKASSEAIISKCFLTAYGTATIGNHTSICEVGKWTAQELTWGKHYDVNDMANTNMVINFGCNVYEAHTSHIPFAQRLVKRRAEKNIPLITFDVRLSNTAAKSDEWIPIRPGTDLAVLLAMANVVMENNLYDRDFIETWTTTTVDTLKNHLKQYTPAWAENISGVSAAKIESLAKQLAADKPGTVLTYRGAVAHYNGTMCERAALMLEAILGTIDKPGGRVHGVGAGWKQSAYPAPAGHPKKLNILDGKNISYPTHHVSNQNWKMIKDGSNGRPELMLVYCNNPVYVNGECGENIEVLKDESLIPMIISCDVAYSETTALADMIIPDATYLERWDWEDMVSYDHIPEFYIRQPLVEPLGEARDLKDVFCEVAKRLGGEVAETMKFGSAREFVRDACDNTPGVKEAGGFSYMAQNGVWYDKNAKPKYMAYAKELGETDLAGTVVDKETGVIWKPESVEAKPEDSYRKTKNAYKAYVGQMVKGKAYAGFKPDKVNKSGLFELYSPLLEDKGHPGLPTWIPIPEHQNLKDNEMILTTFKRNVQTQSRSQNCKYLTEIYHANPAWINPATAAKFGIKDGGAIKVKSSVGEIVTKARVTEGILPGVIAISTHCGHWEHGRYASGKAAPEGRDDDIDMKLKWWDDKGEHPNWIIPNSPDPISGMQRWMDTVVTVSPV